MSKITRMPYAPGLKGVMLWMRERNPRLYAASMRTIAAPNLAGLGITGAAAEVSAAASSTETPKPSVLDKFKELVLAAGQTYLTAEQIKAQKKVLDMQMERLKAGLPAADINMASYGFTGPQLGLNVGSDTQKFALMALAAAGVIYLLGKKL